MGTGLRSCGVLVGQTSSLEDVKKLKNKCEVISAPKSLTRIPYKRAGAVGIHFASSLILAKSISSHLPVTATDTCVTGSSWLFGFLFPDSSPNRYGYPA
jgi:hypothetical protein